ncbi:MAG: DUF3887 domain-containing protein [Chitinophagaceae bacterium]
MKKKLFFVLLAVFAVTFLFGTSYCNAQTADSTIAAKFISLSNRGKFDETGKFFSPAFLEMYTPGDVRELWYYLVQPQGRFHGIISVKEMQQGKSYAVFPTCRYDNADITFAFAFDQNHQISGFHLFKITSPNHSGSTP